MLFFFLCLSAVAAIALLLRFVTAEGDFTLMSKQRVKREEIEDKVVWITGASRGIGKGNKHFLSFEMLKQLDFIDSAFRDNSLIHGEICYSLELLHSMLVCWFCEAFFCYATRSYYPFKTDEQGEILAKQLAALGAKLILSARNEADLQRVKNQLTGKNAPDQVKILPLDLALGEESLREAVEKAVSFFPDCGIDIMIHNAAFERPKTTALDVTEEGLKATFNINVLGTISLTRLLAPFMLKRGSGHFVVMSSAAGKTPAPGQAVYSASKFALNGYFHSLRSELCQKGIKVTVVCPGPIDTSTGATDSGSKGSLEKRLSSQRCAELTIIAASHGLKEAWISYQPVLAVMYLVQYMPTIGFWLMDKVGKNRVDAAAKKGNTYSLGLLFGNKKAA